MIKKSSLCPKIIPYNFIKLNQNHENNIFFYYAFNRNSRMDVIVKINQKRFEMNSKKFEELFSEMDMRKSEFLNKINTEQPKNNKKKRLGKS